MASRSINNYVDKKVRPALGCYGGKAMLCRRILQLAPAHRIYVEPFAGGLNVLLNKFRSEIEVASDLNSELVNFYHILVNQTQDLIERVKTVPFGKITFYAARSAGSKGDELTRAVNFLIRQRMSWSGVGATWAEPTEGKQNSWKDVEYDLPLVADRLRGVSILFRSAFNVIDDYDSPETFIYADPPYYPSTRVSPDVYKVEMKEMDHLRLVRVLRDCKSSVILSGYNHPLYNSELSHWDRVEIDIAAFSSPNKEKKTRRTEILWVKPQDSLL